MVLVALMQQLWEEGKSSSRPRLSILKNLVVMTDSQIDFIIDLYSKARTGELGSDIAACACAGSAPETERPLPSQVSGGEKKEKDTDLERHAATYPPDYDSWDSWLQASEPRGSRLYVFNLPSAVTEDDIRSACAAYGQVDDVHVMPSRKKACAMVLFSDASEADACVAEMNKGFVMGGDSLEVIRAGRPRPAGTTLQ